MKYVNKKWKFELSLPETWTINESSSGKFMPKFFVMLLPMGINLATAKSPFGLSLNIRVGAKLMSIEDLSRVSNQINYYSRGTVGIKGADDVHYFSYDSAYRMKVCKVSIQKDNVQFDVTIREEEDPPDWFANGWKFF